MTTPARPVIRILALLLTLAIGGCGDPPSSAPKAAEKPPEETGDAAAARPLPYRFVRLWENGDVRHQREATGVCVRKGWLYLGGGGGPNARISKVRVEDGEVAWSVKGGSYQPSYPVSNGSVVILGRYHKGGYRALDDGTGAQRWTTAGVAGSMSSACIVGDLAFVGSYHQSFYGLYALDAATGKMRWKTPTGEKIWSTPVAYGNLVLVGCYDGYLYAMEQATGKIVWRLDCGGRIKSNPVVAGDLAFLGVDDQSVAEEYDGTKQQKHFLVVDLSDRRILSRFETKGQWQHKIVASQEQVFFFDRSTLYVLDIENKALAYKITPPHGLLPYPVLAKDRLLLAMRPQPWECCEPKPTAPDPTPVVAYDRRTGEQIGASTDGGIVLGFVGGPLHYAQVGDVVVDLSGPPAAYRLVTD